MFNSIGTFCVSVCPCPSCPVFVSTQQEGATCLPCLPSPNTKSCRISEHTMIEVNRMDECGDLSFVIKQIRPQQIGRKIYWLNCDTYPFGLPTRFGVGLPCLHFVTDLTCFQKPALGVDNWERNSREEASRHGRGR